MNRKEIISAGDKIILVGFGWWYDQWSHPDGMSLSLGLFKGDLGLNGYVI